MPRMRSTALRSIALTLTCLLAAAPACEKESDGPRVVKREGQPDYVQPADDKLMDRAVRKARDTHKTFIAALQQPKPGYRNFSVKKGFPTPGGGQEHIWVSNPKWDGTVFRGKIGNEPVDTKAVALGDVVAVKPEELSDWMYLDGPKLVGGYTVRVLHFQGTPEEQKQFTQQTGMQVPPIDF